MEILHQFQYVTILPATGTSLKFCELFLELLLPENVKMSSLIRNSSAEFFVDIKHVSHVWVILNGAQFSSKSFGLQNLKGRREAVALLMDRSYDRIRILTTNWTLDGPPEAPEISEPLAVTPQDFITNLVVGTSPGRKSLITPDEYDAIRDVIHTLYKSKAYVTLKTLLEPVYEKLGKRVAKTTLYRVLRRMGFKYQ